MESTASQIWPMGLTLPIPALATSLMASLSWEWHITIILDETWSWYRQKFKIICPETEAMPSPPHYRIPWEM